MGTMAPCSDGQACKATRLARATKSSRRRPGCGGVPGMLVRPLPRRWDQEGKVFAAVFAFALAAALVRLSLDRSGRP